VAAAAAAAATTASARWAGGFCGAGYGGAEDGEPDGGFFTGTFGTGDFLLAVDDNFFELRIAILADVFVDGHARFLFVKGYYSNFQWPAWLRSTPGGG
jgi:hypothetical protein